MAKTKKQESSSGNTVKLTAETVDALECARTVRDWFSDMDLNTLIFTVTLEFMKREGEECLNEWLSSFF